PVLYKEYKVKPGTDLSTYKHPTLKKTIFDLIDEKADEGYTEPVWKGQDADDANNFVAAAGNSVFTATATKTFKVTVKPNGGTGDEKVEIKKKDETFKLPAANTFTPPNDNQEFSGWKIGDDTNLKQPGTEITISGDTEINAIWKPIEFKVDFKAGEGASGSMEDKTVTKGSEYELPTPTFTAPKDKVFAGWKVGDQEGVKQAGAKIDIKDNVTLTATWKDIEYKVTFNGSEGTGSMDEKLVKKGNEYTLPENGFTAPANKEFDGWMVGTEKKAVGDTITVNGDTEVKAVWKDIEHKVTFNGTEGSGKMDEKVVKQEDEYTLPENGFTAPEGKQFDGWMVGTEKKSVGDKIVINSDTEVKAIWKDIEYKITFEGNGGEGSMNPETVKKGEKFKLPANGFTAPKGKVFAGWQIVQAPNKVFAPETMIEVTGNIVVKAIWKDVPSKPDAPRWNDSPGFIFPRSEAKEMEIGRHYRYLYGYTDKTVRPEGNITRAEAAALIARLAGLDMSDDSKPNFADTPSRWYNSAINIMVKMDLMFADKDGNFRPNEAITRAEFARALYYVDKKNDKVAPFADVKGHVYEDAINQAYGNGRISGYPDGTFRPDAKIQRAEVARILNQYANRGTTLEGMAGVAKDLIQFTDITPSHWAYCEVMEAANNHEYQREKGTQAETWLRILRLDLKIAK
ncbi:MAG: S-layer homology domain-containing protein, partial [Aedoeadaptatus pacaensis]